MKLAATEPWLPMAVSGTSRAALARQEPHVLSSPFSSDRSVLFTTGVDIMVRGRLPRSLRATAKRARRGKLDRAYRRRFMRPWIEGLEPRLMLAGDLLIAHLETDSILRFDGTSGAPLGAFVPSGAGGLVDPHEPTFGPDGNLYVISQANGAQKILRFSGSTGAFLNTFVDTGAGGFAGASTMTFGPDGDLYVATATSRGVLRYDGSTGAFEGIAASGNGIQRLRRRVRSGRHCCTCSIPITPLTRTTIASCGLTPRQVRSSTCSFRQARWKMRVCLRSAPMDICMFPT